MSPDHSLSPTHPERPLVYIRLRPIWTYIEGVRDFTGFFCDLTFPDPKLAQRARVVMQETLENAIKYSLRGPDSELEVTIHSTPAPEHLDRLRTELDTIASKAPQQAYIDAFARAAACPDASAQLGLARIRYEGEAELLLEEQDGGRIRLTAMGAI